MSDLYGILGMGREALLAQQKGIDVTGHNIANVNTPGFSRQRVQLQTREPISFQPGQIGTGVRAQEIQRVYDRFLGVQIRNENQSLGRWESQSGALEKAEMIFNETTGYGLNQAMSEFWNAWQDLSNNPSGQAERTVLIAKSQTLAEQFRDLCGDLNQIRKDVDTSIVGTMEEINLLADQIADLNQKIFQAEVGGQNANDYRDERELLLNQLSSLIDITSFENSEGKVTVLVGNGKPLVENIYSWDLSTESNGDDLHDIVWCDRDGNEVAITDTISGGRVNGWIEVRDVRIPEYLNSLSVLAQGIMAEVNTVHQGGFALNGTTGIDFFEGVSAADIEVNRNIVNDLTLVAAASEPGGLPGDNRNALLISQLQNELTMKGNTATFDDCYNALSSKVGSDVRTTSANLCHQTAISEHLTNYRESISGVSLDEEMINLVEYQHAYDAAAKLIVTVDEMLQTIISMV
ncbi:MAG: flagellar hook-associated protein FlgK [Deltaproteobacteria bacterium]|nr:flagellar hook-associated protein FlgK [Deltaproteobacteria bacterium]